ncbi:50S ribosomal protein L30 [Bacillus fonticola]|uniref:50S ribosomal protein L30 n=1 Tax=Bacillus fonticola TaxID=2728853 RepID=UPI001475422F|nr:50S ribosomal protein L30 [Bacillus fonticola]
MTKNLEVTLERSLIGRPKDQRVTVSTLGLTKIRQTVVHQDSQAIRGMIAKVSHLVSVKEV